MSESSERQGGSYKIDEQGDLVLVERTQNSPPAESANEEPASAGFFSPVETADADSQPTAPVTVADSSTDKQE